MTDLQMQQGILATHDLMTFIGVQQATDCENVAKLKVCLGFKTTVYLRAIARNFSENFATQHFLKVSGSCQPMFPNFMANRQVPKFSSNNCAQRSKKMFTCPKFHTNPIFKYTKCHISTNLSNFLQLCLLYCQKLFVLAPTNHRFAEKNRLSGNTGASDCWRTNNSPP